MAIPKPVHKRIFTKEMHIYHQTLLLISQLPVFTLFIPNYYKPLLIREKTFNTPSLRYSAKHRLKKQALLQIKNIISEKFSFNSINSSSKSSKTPPNSKISNKLKR